MSDLRKASITRTTKETDINVEIDLDGEGNYNIETGIGFFDHMLTLFAKHGILDLEVKARGDLYVDCHHTIEDVGITLGKCIEKADLDKAGIKRYGTSFVPMDEALCMISMDMSGRPYLVFEGDFNSQKVGDMDTEMVEEFFRALAFNAGITLHAKVLYGKNAHHMIEGLFKALGRALREAVTKDERIKGVMSTKGNL
ncbi:imidazoleglycerol-phosphate dehydratase HisB [Clostridiaceae bacterium UIB06]|uniref:Imidazoleglycerol-phosphate dehydratase n=1 Tax=Clostridium thailandense TaxID=2794346 RepID=A0A949TLD0_9CLOT|nr:imidazoleglycerol-phosphate dehydratase HisB [Clostridium thailandense]MBV7274455.1 imidazoleglycerol-phosphate dehydratase HisB [Clostridium thailandense]MCH5136641.1 imidazoleglycerol-phosphate dehydratase HisB [Clostridiaceae bacterium UIB06]